jgi:hypothetical protein
VKDFLEYPIDPEISGLLSALNMMEGIRTIWSCCGHGRGRIRIDTLASNRHAMNSLRYWLEPRNNGGIEGWQISYCSVYQDPGEKKKDSCRGFRLSGPVGRYQDGEKIAALIKSSLLRGYGMKKKLTPAEKECLRLSREQERLFSRLPDGITVDEFDRRLDELIRQREENIVELRKEREA